MFDSSFFRRVGGYVGYSVAYIWRLRKLCSYCAVKIYEVICRFLGLKIRFFFYYLKLLIFKC